MTDVQNLQRTSLDLLEESDNALQVKQIEAVSAQEAARNYYNAWLAGSMTSMAAPVAGASKIAPTDSIAGVDTKDYRINWLADTTANAATATRASPITPVGRKESLPQLPPSDRSSEIVDERTLQRLIFQAMDKNRKSLEIHRDDRMRDIHKAKKDERELHKLKIDTQLEIVKMENDKKIADTVSIVTTIVAIGAFIGGLIATAATAGAALSLLFPAIQGLSGITGAGAEITKTHFKAQLDKLQAAFIDLREKGAASNSLSQDFLKETKSLTTQLGSYDRAYREALENALKAVQQIFN